LLTTTGWHPKRFEFEPEWDNDAEVSIAEIEFKETDTSEEEAAKLRLLEVYNKRLDEVCSGPCLFALFFDFEVYNKRLDEVCLLAVVCWVISRCTKNGLMGLVLVKNGLAKSCQLSCTDGFINNVALLVREQVCSMDSGWLLHAPDPCVADTVLHFLLLCCMFCTCAACAAAGVHSGEWLAACAARAGGAGQAAHS
jgi:hypothetical protein